MEAHSQQHVDETPGPREQPGAQPRVGPGSGAVIVPARDYQQHRKLLDDAVEEMTASFVDNGGDFFRDCQLKLWEWLMGFELEKGVPKAAYMQQGMQILGDMFFLGEFRKSTVLFVWSPEQKMREDYGLTSFSPGQYKPYWIQICMDDFSDDSGDVEFKNAAVGVLLHELCHATLGLHSHRAGYKKIDDKAQRPEGLTGHTSPWFFLAASVEIVVNKLCCLEEVRLRPLEGLLYEISEPLEDGGTSELRRYMMPTRKKWQAFKALFSEEDIPFLLSGVPEGAMRELEEAYDPFFS